MMSTMIIVFVAVFSLIGIFLNLIAFKMFIGGGRISSFRFVAILKIFVNILFMLSWITYFYVGAYESIGLFYVSGALLVLLSIILFKIVHDEIYVKRGSTFKSLVPVPIFLILAEKSVEEIRGLITNTYSLGLGFILAINFLTVYFSIMLYREMKGGSLLWLYVAIYTITIFMTSLLSVMATYFNLSGTISDLESFQINILSLIVPDVIMLLMGMYYVKKVKPLLEEILK